MNYTPEQHLKTTYYLITIILFAPVLLWPIPLIIFDNPMLIDIIIPKWHLSISILLIASLCMDSMMYGSENHRQSVSHVLWVAVLSLFIIKNPSNAWLLAILFLAHGFRSGIQLFRKGNQPPPWVMVSWSRDNLSAITILAWFYSIS